MKKLIVLVLLLVCLIGCKKKEEPPPLPMTYHSEDNSVREQLDEINQQLNSIKRRLDRQPNPSIEQEIYDVFGSEARIALAVAKAESGLNPKAINRNWNGTKDVGVFQINDKHGWTEQERLNWRQNIRMAKEIRDRWGWGEWVAFNNQSYRNYL